MLDTGRDPTNNAAMLAHIKERTINAVLSVVVFLWVFAVWNPRYQHHHCQSCAILYDETHCTTYPCPFDGIAGHQPVYRTHRHA